MRNDIQTIVVDDNSDEALVDFSHFPGLNRSNTEIYFTKGDQGAGYARNIGLQHALGKWILFADADDFFCSGLSEILSEYSQSTADAILFPVQIVDSDSLQPAHRDPWLNNIIFRTDYSPNEKLMLCVAPWTKLIRRQLISNYNIHFDEIQYSNDAIFSTLVAVHAKHVTVDTNHVIYTLTERSTSLTKHVTREALRIRLDVEMRRYGLIKKYGYVRCHFQNYKKILLLWSSNFGLKEVLRSLFYLTKTGYIFVHYDSSIALGFQNSALYCVLYALRRALFFNKR